MWSKLTAAVSLFFRKDVQHAIESAVKCRLA
jgi:hypothetical protein